MLHIPTYCAFIFAMGLVGGIAGIGIEFFENRSGSLNFILATFSFLGALFGGAATYWAFGRDGRAGWALAAFGAVLATAVGGAFGALFVLFRPEALMMGFLFAPLMIAGHLPLIPIWLGLMTLLHAWMKGRRRALQAGEQIVS